MTEVHSNISSRIPSTDHKDSFSFEIIWVFVLPAVEALAFKAISYTLKKKNQQGIPPVTTGIYLFHWNNSIDSFVTDPSFPLSPSSLSVLWTVILQTAQSACELSDTSTLEVNGSLSIHLTGWCITPHIHWKGQIPCPTGPIVVDAFKISCYLILHT